MAAVHSSTSSAQSTENLCRPDVFVESVTGNRAVSIPARLLRSVPASTAIQCGSRGRRLWHVAVVSRALTEGYAGSSSAGES
jgi:hypothetical protein